MIKLGWWLVLILKKKLGITISVFFLICSLNCCCFVSVEPAHEDKFSIKFSNVDWQLNDNGSELDIKLEIMSDVTSNVRFILNVAKESSNEMTYMYEGFKDSLEVDGFFVRAYSIKDYHRIMNGLSSSVDFPVYVKDVFIEEGKNYENFTIIFPRNIVSNAENIYVDVGIIIFNNEIKSKFNEVQAVRDDYFKIFADSSFVSYIFTKQSWIEHIVNIHGSEPVNRCYGIQITYHNSYFNERLYIR